jgi:hypothetical protein
MVVLTFSRRMPLTLGGLGSPYLDPSQGGQQGTVLGYEGTVLHSNAACCRSGAVVLSTFLPDHDVSNAPMAAGVASISITTALPNANAAVGVDDFDAVHQHIEDITDIIPAADRTGLKLDGRGRGRGERRWESRC